MKKNTSDRLKEIMNERGIRQVDILEMVKPYCAKYNQKINKSHLSQWVSGINEPNQQKLTILALALNVSEPWLMGFDVSPYRIDPKEKAEQDAELIYKYSFLSDRDKKIIIDMIDSMLKQNS